MADQPETNSSQDEREHHDRGIFDFPDFGALARSFASWCRANPAGLALLVTLLGVIGYFYFGVKAFMSLSQTPAQWIASGWSSWNDQEHCVAIIPIALLLVVLRWRDLQAAEKKPSNAGLWWVGLGVFAYIAGIRCVEGRYTIFALPLLSLGVTMFLFGKQVARILLFPCAFLLFMVPMGGLVQSTADLQSVTAKIVNAMFALTGPRIHTNGNFIYSSDGRFEPLEVAGGCSGIRSLMAMTMLAALYAYFVMRTPMRGLILLACSVIFALIGNIVRVATVVLVARFIGPGAAHAYHDWSGFVFFPVAVLAMVGVGNLLNREWNFGISTSRPAAHTEPVQERTTSPEPVASVEPPKPKATYDY